MPSAQLEQRIEFVAMEGMAFGRALHLDEGAGFVHDHVHVGLGLGVFGVFEVQHRLAADDADRDRRHLPVHRAVLSCAVLLQRSQACASAT